MAEPTRPCSFGSSAMSETDEILESVLRLHPAIRYAAISAGSAVEMLQRAGITAASDSQSDRFEELFVNPALIALARARGNLDCGGLYYLLIRYGNFLQAVIPLPLGHISVAIEPGADWQSILRHLLRLLADSGQLPALPEHA